MHHSTLHRRRGVCVDLHKLAKRLGKLSPRLPTFPGHADIAPRFYGAYEHPRASHGETPSIIWKGGFAIAIKLYDPEA